MKIARGPAPLSKVRLHELRGKLMMEHPPSHDIWHIVWYVTWLEDALDELDQVDALGTEGWRHQFNHPDAD